MAPLKMSRRQIFWLTSPFARCLLENQHVCQIKNLKFPHYSNMIDYVMSLKQFFVKYRIFEKYDTDIQSQGHFGPQLFFKPWSAIM